VLVIATPSALQATDDSMQLYMSQDTSGIGRQQVSLYQVNCQFMAYPWL